MQWMNLALDKYWGYNLKKKMFVLSVGFGLKIRRRAIHPSVSGLSGTALIAELGGLGDHPATPGTGFGIDARRR
jgi:hypothetical protein